jgi:hypothetical protein
MLLLIWLLTFEVVRKVVVMFLQRSTALGTDLVNLILNQCHKLVVMGKMDVYKAWELMAKMIHLLGRHLLGPHACCHEGQ